MSIEQHIQELEKELREAKIQKEQIDRTSDEPIDYAYSQADFYDKWQGFGRSDY